VTLAMVISYGSCLVVFVSTEIVLASSSVSPNIYGAEEAARCISKIHTPYMLSNFLLASNTGTSTPYHLWFLGCSCCPAALPGLPTRSRAGTFFGTPPPHDQVLVVIVLILGLVRESVGVVVLLLALSLLARSTHVLRPSNHNYSDSCLLPTTTTSYSG
jgi:hypothetical protein